MNEPNQTEMTDADINVVIAEFCGWRHIKETSNVREEFTGWNSAGQFDAIPQYTSDLNALHEAEKSLTRKQWERYSNKLMVAIRDSDLTLNGSNIEARYKTPHATARQRAEAFVRTIKA